MLAHLKKKKIHGNFKKTCIKTVKEMKPPMRIWQCVDGHAICAGCRQGFTMKKTFKMTITMTFTMKIKR